MSPTYLISSHVRYALPLQYLLQSMRQISRDRIIVVVGGAPKFEHLEEEWGTVWRVPHNSFDYTAAIEFCRRQPPAEHLFLLHDTCEFQPDTDTRICEANPAKWATAAYEGAQCNFMLLKREWLLYNRARLELLTNCTKLKAIQKEGFLWKRCVEHHRAIYPDPSMEVVDYEDRTYNGAHRICERYNSINLLKRKACYGQNMHDLTITP